MTSELNCKVEDDDGVSCFNEEAGNRSITLVLIRSTFGVEFGGKMGDDFDKEVVNDSTRLVVNSTFGNGFACADAKDAISSFDNEAVDEPIIAVVNSIVGNGRRCDDELII